MKHPKPSPVSRVAREDIVKRFAAAPAILRTPLSVRFPILKPAILLARRTTASMRHAMNPKIARRRQDASLPYRVYKHESLLLRKLGDADMRLQHNKVQNLRAAIRHIDGVVVQPGETFSLWALVGNPSRRRGFVNGMLLSRGKIVEGLGGGLCQLANLLHWMFLHAPFRIVERYHHSLDVFPDSGRTVPFGSGATILYNFVDLKAKNTSAAPIQIRLWLSETQLHGSLQTTDPDLDAYRVQETDQCFVHAADGWHRYNRLWRVSKGKNKKLVSELVVTNLAPVLYKIDAEAMRARGIPMLTLNRRRLGSIQGIDEKG